MRDLYSKLGIERNAGDAEIAASLQRNPEMSACSAILLNQQKRAIYDGTYSTLKVIGALRQRLKLHTGDSWFSENCADFALRPSFAPASAGSGASGGVKVPPHANHAALQPATVKSKPPARSRRRAALIWSMIGVILLIALYTLWLN